ncbi:MAG TPA: hypothetical protein VFP84_32020 [Kofleriaceae bacterium]|nr:hypothetical protein [Kofleriaceae bacterium]
MILIVAACGCGKKKPLDDKSPTTGGTASAGSAAPAVPGTTEPVHTAEGGEVKELPIINDCPKSLAGSETVARTIKKACGPITITGEYDVDGSLTLEAGAVLKFQDGASLDVGYNKAAKLIVKGTAQDPVVMTSAGDAAPGAWHGVRLYNHADRSSIDGLVIEHAGDDKGALYVDGQDIAIKSSIIRDAKDVGLHLDRNARLAELTGNTFEKAGQIAIKAYPAAVGAFGSNKFTDASAVVQIEGGSVEEPARWQNPGAPYVVIGEIDVDGKNGRATLEIAAGTELRFKDAELDIGYSREATLVLAGTADKPVVLTAEDKTPGAWHGVYVYGKGEIKIANAAISFAGGGSNDRGALYLDHATASVTGTSFKDNKRGVTIKAGSTIKAFDHNQLSASPEPAISSVANAIGSLGAGNTLDKDAHIEVTEGRIERTQTWLPQGVAYEITSELSVDDKAMLTLAPGVELAFAGDQQLSVGYSSDGTLKAAGTKDAPIKLRATRDDVPWKGVWLYGHALGSELSNVQITGTGGDAGIVLDHGASAKIADVTCTRCKNAALTSKCGATFTATNVKAGAGTPTGELKPTCN